jgi:hypothetical protein
MQMSETASSQSLVAGLKRSIKDLRQSLEERDRECETHKRNIKLTQFNQMVTELNLYKQECVRLRDIAEKHVSNFINQQQAKEQME